MTELNKASKIYIGSGLASKVCVGSTQAWPMVFRPTDISGCQIWLDASKSYWTNLGAGSQPTVTGTPTIVAGALNGLPVMRITQAAAKFRWYSGTGVDKDWTLIYVGRRWKLSAGRVITAFSTAANLLVGFHGNEMEMCYVEAWLTGVGSMPPSTTQWKMYSADSTPVTVARFFNNGVLNSSGAVTPAKGWGNTFCISGYMDDAAVATSQECDCEIAEVVQYNRRLTDVERQQVENYLRTKWLSGQSALWKPTDLGANLTAWFDSSDLSSVQITGAGVSNWFNRGVGGMTVGPQATDTYRPTYASQGGVNFTLGKGMTAAGGPASFDVAIVATPNPPAAAPVDWRTMLRSATNHEMIIETGTTRFGVYHSVSGFLPAGGLTWGNVAGIAYARVAPSAVTMMSRDGGALTSTTTALTAGSVAPAIGFGCYLGTTPPTQGFGLVKEVIFVPYNSSDTTRQKMEGYLAHKWGLDSLLSAGHPYKAAPP